MQVKKKSKVSSKALNYTHVSDFKKMFPIGTFKYFVSKIKDDRKIYNYLCTSSGDIYREVQTFSADGSYIAHVHYEKQKLSAGGTGGYKRFCFNVGKYNKQYFVHKLVIQLFGGYTHEQVKNLWVDHIDRNPLNNNISNLRLVTPQQNAMNRNNSSSFLGKYEIIAEKNGVVLTFQSQGEAAKTLGVGQCSIANALRSASGNKSCDGWVFSRGKLLSSHRGKEGIPCQSINIKTGGRCNWESGLAAAKALNLDNTSVSACVRGKQKTTGNYRFVRLLNK